ncbi:hypothetical protein LCGC14_2602650 [marine sediment metagenome]|uniref:PARP-type domain-containing protein n=1 Tax=marine sediment metagenome TaxID=412755 RepID=A0A0F9A8J8_9ZZZZ
MIYTQKTKHRKRCIECSRLIQDGEEILMHKVITEKYYPVKGLMKFVKWQFRHIGCA